MTSKTLIKANALKQGDCVGLVAPGGRPYKPSVVSRAARLVEDMGFKPVIGEHVLEVKGHTAGSVAERVDDFNKFLNDDAISALFCITGGFGSLSLLPHLDMSAIERSPKIIVGGGENTAVVLGLHARTGLITFHGPNLQDIKSESSFVSFKSALTSRSSLEPIVAATVDSAWSESHSHVAVEGIGQGHLLGGNLTGLVSLFGTEFEPELSGAVLFLTDHDERNDIIDRWFTTLYVSGQLEKVKAVALGYFDNCGNKGSFNLLSVEDSCAERLVQLSLPSIFDFPIAGGDCPTVPIGVSSALDTRRRALEFLQAALT
ncbi:MAG: LD-carboxypeptidase [Cyanobacteria bacterium SZAS-4]|nr:LD-carboxypeptidase [Cyanobacteria bacterium SZAS-4]